MLITQTLFENNFDELRDFYDTNPEVRPFCDHYENLPVDYDYLYETYFLMHNSYMKPYYNDHISFITHMMQQIQNRFNTNNWFKTFQQHFTANYDLQWITITLKAEIDLPIITEKAHPEITNFIEFKRDFLTVYKEIKYYTGEFINEKIIINEFGFINATRLCETFKGRFDKWNAKKRVKKLKIRLIKLLMTSELKNDKNALVLQKPILGLSKNELKNDENLLITHKNLISSAVAGGRYTDNRITGTYLHPNLIINLTEYINPEFEDFMIEITKNHLVKLELSKKEKLLAELKQKKLEIQKVSKERNEFKNTLDKIYDVVNELKISNNRMENKLENYGDKVLKAVTQMNVELRKLSKKTMETNDKNWPTLFIVLTDVRKINDTNYLPFKVIRQQAKTINKEIDEWVEKAIYDENVVIIGNYKTASAVSLFCNIRDTLKEKGVLNIHYSNFNINNKISLPDFIKLVKEMANIPINEIGVIGDLINGVILK